MDPFYFGTITNSKRPSLRFRDTQGPPPGWEGESVRLSRRPSSPGPGEGPAGNKTAGVSTRKGVSQDMLSDT